ncbi:AraC family transcriptional regulator [Aquirhabdus parva]|uniref:AraC family transcriptional regulator n=1 Tax=Aquirhabdus parva TaxID=2283318 RepID=A0A345PA99_9GAMM|nr:AraC family transcriptional regulator [Aquirhabdus parva]AXI04208.1 AraC family transcriptional regulator [Aquirhabdus parva]
MRKTTREFLFPVSHAELTLSLIRARQGNEAQYFERMGLTPEDLVDPNQYLTLAQFKTAMQLGSEYMLPGEPHFLQLLAHFPPTAHGLVGIAALTSATLGDALNVAIEFFPLLMPSMELHREDLHHESRVYIKRLQEFGSPFDEVQMEFVIAGFARMTEFVSGTQLHARPQVRKDTQVQLTHIRTENLEAYEHFFGKPVQFGSARNGFTISRSILNQPLLTHNRITHDMLLTTLSRQLKSIPQARPLTQRVQRLLTQGIIHGQQLDAAEIASQLSMSVRTLARRLSEEESSLLELTKSVRMERAEWLLTSGELPLSKVAQQLGFSSQAAFTRAFKQATGRTPGDLRKHPMQPDKNEEDCLIG